MISSLLLWFLVCHALAILVIALSLAILGLVSGNPTQERMGKELAFWTVVTLLGATALVVAYWFVNGGR